MLVRKKYVVQKSFRIDEQVERDLEILSKLTERSQNDLVNVAIMELLQDNKSYFINTAVLEHFQSQLEDGNEVFEPFEMGGLRVEMEYCNDTLKVKHTVKDGNTIVEEYTKEFQDEKIDDIEDYLLSLHIHIAMSDDTKKYIEDRVDYRDYVKVRK